MFDVGCWLPVEAEAATAVAADEDDGMLGLLLVGVGCCWPASPPAVVREELLFLPADLVAVSEDEDEEPDSETLAESACCCC